MKQHLRESWAKSAVVYQIYPRSFYDSNADGIGDLQGIIAKLDYLNDGTDRSLGVDAIWLSPVYTSPMHDFGYDIADHCAIDPIFGTLADLDELITEAHARGMKVLMDYIPGHTSIDHQWFQESRSSLNNPKRDWYIWKDANPDGSPPNNWVGVFGGSRWEWDEKTNQYYLHTFLKEQPDLNWRNPEVREAMLQVLHFWLKRGIDGFRVDSFNDIYKDARFLDEPINPHYTPGKQDPFYAYQHIYTRNQPERNALVKLFTDVLRSYGDRFMVTESYVDLAELVALYEAGDSSHAPFNFQFILLAWEAQAYKKFLNEFHASIKPEYLPTYVLGNHDRSRVATRIGPHAARTAAMLQLTIRGMPIIYYGEELGMEDTPIPPEKVQDPFGVTVKNMKLGRDPQRTPMQWTSGSAAGFSTAEPWLPVGLHAEEVNVEKELQDATSMLMLYKKLISLRKQSEALLYGGYQSLETNNDHIFAFMRGGTTERIVVILNFSHEAQQANVGFGSAQLLCTTYADKDEKTISLTDVRLEPYEGYICRLT